jgi:hypothetical protein
MEFLIPILIALGFVAVLLYSVGLQRRAVKSQRDAMSSVAESLEFQRRAEKSMAESLELQRRSVALQEELIRELRKSKDSAERREA